MKPDLVQQHASESSVAASTGRYLFYCIDNPGTADLRQHHLAAHLAYIEGIITRIEVAGPLHQQDSEDQAGGPIGSCFVYRAGSPTEALALLKGDPYYQAGIWQKIESYPFSAVAGNWVGGTTWQRDLK